MHRSPLPGCWVRIRRRGPTWRWCVWKTMKHWFRIYGIWNCATASLSRSDEADLPPTERLNALYDLPIRTDTEPDLDIAFALAERHGLSFYDAIYLELAAVSIGRLNTSIKSQSRCLEPQMFCGPTRSAAGHVVRAVLRVCDKSVTDTVSAVHWCSHWIALPRALRIAEYIGIGRQAKSYDDASSFQRSQVRDL